MKEKRVCIKWYLISKCGSLMIWALHVSLQRENMEGKMLRFFLHSVMHVKMFANELVFISFHAFFSVTILYFFLFIHDCGHIQPSVTVDFNFCIFVLVNGEPGLKAGWQRYWMFPVNLSHDRTSNKKKLTIQQNTMSVNWKCKPITILKIERILF